MELLQRVSESLARKTSRRGLFGRGAEVATGTLLGVAAGTLTRPGPVAAHHSATHCAFPGPPCTCDGCSREGVCAKPCIVMTVYYASGCWVSSNSAVPGGLTTCCDCDCRGFQGRNVCGCGTDYHGPGGAGECA